MTDDEGYALLVQEEVIVEGHHKFRAGNHARHKAVFRSLNEPGKEDARRQLDRALAYRVVVDAHGMEVDFNCLTGPDTGGRAMANRLAPILSEILGRDLPVIQNDKLGDNSFTIDGAWPANPKGWRALVFEDVVTTGGSLWRFTAALREHRVETMAIFAFLNREGQTAHTLGVQYFVPLIDRPMPSVLPEHCEQCRAGVPLSPHH